MGIGKKRKVESLEEGEDDVTSEQKLNLRVAVTGVRVPGGTL